MATVRAYTAIPKRIHLVSTRSKSPYWDKLIVFAELRKVVAGIPGGEIAGGLSRGALAGYCGIGGTVELTDVMVTDGIHHDWRFPLDLEKRPEQTLQLAIAVMNGRGMPDHRWAAWILAVGAVGALGTSFYLDPEKTAAALERINKEVNRDPLLSQMVDTVLDEYVSLWQAPDACQGLVFNGTLTLDPEKLEYYAAVPGSGTPLTGNSYSDTISLRMDSVPISSRPGCGNPLAFIDVEVERRVQLLFDPTPAVTVKVTGVRDRVVDDADVRGNWVDAPSVNEGTTPVFITITREEEEFADKFRVKVVERVGDDILVNEVFSGVSPVLRQSDAPWRPSYAARTDADPFDVGGGGGFIGHDLPDTRDLTWSMTLRSGDIRSSRIVFWRRNYLDAAQRVVRSEVWMFYTRVGDDGITNTATWLAKWRPVA